MNNGLEQKAFIKNAGVDAGNINSAGGREYYQVFPACFL